MDGFRDTITKEFDAQTMINANSEADAREIDHMKEQIGHCEECLDEIRSVNLKSNENVQQMQNLLKQISSKTAAAPVNADGNKDEENEGYTDKLDKLSESIKEQFAESDDAAHKDSVRVYRNVQASMIEELDKRVQVLSDKIDQISQERSSNKGGKVNAILVIQIITLIVAAAGSSAVILSYLGIVL